MKNAFSKILILIIIAILVASGFFVWQKWLKPESRIKNQESRLPEGIEVIEQGDKKIVRNTVEGYEVTVPREWEVPSSPLVDEKIVIRWLGPEQKLETELQDGAYIKVYIDENPKNLSIKDWAREYWTYSPEKLNSIKIDNLDIIRTTEKVIFGQNDPNPIIIEDSQITDLSFSINNKIYTYSCTAVGSKYVQYTQECEKIMIENIKKFFQ